MSALSAHRTGIAALCTVGQILKRRGQNRREHKLEVLNLDLILPKQLFLIGIVERTCQYSHAQWSNPRTGEILHVVSERTEAIRQDTPREEALLDQPINQFRRDDVEHRDKTLDDAFDAPLSLVEINAK